MWEIAVHLAAACGVCGGVFLCCFFIPRDVLDEILNLVKSVSECFLPTLQWQKGFWICLIFGQSDQGVR